MNPYIIVAVMIVIDIVSIPFVIKSILKKDMKRKGAVIALFLTVFIAVEAAVSVFYIRSNQFYDREGNTYTSQESVLYYDRDGTEYILHQTKADRWHFISKDGKRMITSERVYVDSEGYIVLDEKNEFKKSDREYVYTDADGNEYYRAQEIKWTHNGGLKVKNRD